MRDGISLPLHRAVAAGDCSKVRERLAAGDDVNRIAKDSGIQHMSCSPLSIAVRNKERELVRILLDSGADPHFLRLPDQKSVLQTAVSTGDVEVVRMLIQAGADINDVNKEGFGVIHVAAVLRNAEMVQYLLSAGAPYDMADSYQMRPLMHTAQQGSEDCVRILLMAGANPSNSDHEGTTALHFASRALPDAMTCVPGFEVPSAEGRSEVVKLLLQTGLAADVTNIRGETPLMLANDLPIVKALLEGGASTLLADINFNSVMHHAGEQGCSSPVICILFKFGANPTVRNVHGQTPADVAHEIGHHAAAQLLEMLATKYREKEAAALVNGNHSVDISSVGVAGSDDEMKAVAVSSSESGEGSTMSPAEAEANQSAKKEKQHKVLKPCLHCEELTHRRCARCKTTFFCSRDCQMVTMAEHKPICLQIYEERQRSKAERKAKKEEEA